MGLTNEHDQRFTQQGVRLDVKESGRRPIRSANRAVAIGNEVGIWSEFEQVLVAPAFRFEKPLDGEEAVLAVKRALEAYELRAYSEKQDILSGKLSQELRQLQQVLRPFLLSSLKAIGRELGDERIEQSRTILDTAISLCATQARIVRRRLQFIESALDGIRHRLDSVDGYPTASQGPPEPF